MTSLGTISLPIYIFLFLFLLEHLHQRNSSESQLDCIQGSVLLPI
jgi:hypothetical protein